MFELEEGAALLFPNRLLVDWAGCCPNGCDAGVALLLPNILPGAGDVDGMFPNNAPGAGEAGFGPPNMLPGAGEAGLLLPNIAPGAGDPGFDPAFELKLPPCGLAPNVKPTLPDAAGVGALLLAPNWNDEDWLLLLAGAALF